MLMETVETDLGHVAVAVGPDGLVAVTVPLADAAQARRSLAASLARRREPDAGGSGALLAAAVAAAQDHCAGRQPRWPEELDLTGYGPFQRRALLAARTIPWGETRSYQWLAEAAGSPRGARAAGQAMARNELCLVVPCHRVVASDGCLGGFGGGLDLKARLLWVERTAQASVGH